MFVQFLKDIEPKHIEFFLSFIQVANKWAGADLNKWKCRVIYSFHSELISLKNKKNPNEFQLPCTAYWKSKGKLANQTFREMHGYSLFFCFFIHRQPKISHYSALMQLNTIATLKSWQVKLKRPLVLVIFWIYLYPLAWKLFFFFFLNYRYFFPRRDVFLQWLFRQPLD